MLDEQSGQSESTDAVRNNKVSLGSSGAGIYGKAAPFEGKGHSDSGGASRFFYVAKPSTAERNNGGENRHPTVKSIELMRYLVRLVTPPNGIVLDPFAGSGTTCIAAKEEFMQFVGIELQPEYAELAMKRIGSTPDSLFSQAA